MSDEIRNCEFRFKCPKDWDSLAYRGNGLVIYPNSQYDYPIHGH